jgi:hypothetical protein
MAETSHLDAALWPVESRDYAVEGRRRLKELAPSGQPPEAI